MKNKHLKLRDCIIATPDVRSRDYFVLTTGPKKPLYTPVTGITLPQKRGTKTAAIKKTVP